MIALFCVPLLSSAQKVNEEDARQKAREFFNQKSKSESHAAKRRVATQKAQAELSLANKDDAYYVFNVGKKDGFIIVSGDERVTPVLGYSDQGEFKNDMIPDGLKDLLNQYKAEIDYVQSHPEVAKAPRKAEERKAIEPMLQTVWGQGEPFNRLAPLCGKSGHSVTGCVATAMAQVMYYHKYPEHGYGSKSYDWEWYDWDEHIWHTESLTADFSQSYYDWDNMMDDYTSFSTDKSGKSVAVLMKDCGYAVEMIYGDASTGSGAHVSAIAPALKNHFGFASSTALIWRSSFTTEDWKTILYKELSANRPVIYGGSNYDGLPTRPESHSFVCDGYMDDYFHFNFGWDGECDGFYLIDAIQANWISIEGGYNTDQHAILCYPHEVPDAFSYSDYKLASSPYSLKVTNVIKPSYYYKNHSFTVKATIVNEGEEEYHGSLALHNGESVENADIHSFAAYTKLDLRGGESKEIEFLCEPNYSDNMHMQSFTSTSFFICDCPRWQSISEVFTIESKDISSAPLYVDGLYYILNDEGDFATIVSPTDGCYQGNIVVPECVEFDGRTIPVKRIGSHAFGTMNTQIESVTLPASIESFGAMPFGNCLKIIVNNPKPVPCKAFLYSDPRVVTLVVPNGAGNMYADDVHWGKAYRIYEDENLVANRIIFSYWIHGAANIAIDGRMFKGRGETFADATKNVDIRIEPMYDNRLLRVETVNDRNITSSHFTLNPCIEGNDNIHVFVGFEKDGSTYSVINNREVILLSAFVNGNLEATIPESIEYNGNLYTVGNVDYQALRSVKKLTVPWTEPIDVGEDAFGSWFGTSLTDLTLNVPDGSADAYKNHPVWGRVAKIVENGKVVKENIEIAINCIDSGIDAAIINGNAYNYSSYIANKGEDVTFTIKPSLPFHSVSLCYLNGVDIVDSLDATNSYTIRNVQEPMELKYQCSFVQDGICYRFNSTHSEISDVADENGIYQYSDSIYEYWGPCVIPGKYSGHLVIPSEITIPEYKTEHCQLIGKTQLVASLSPAMLNISECEGLISVDLPSSISTIYQFALYDSHYKYLTVHWDEPISVDSLVFRKNDNWNDTSVFDNVTLIVPYGTIDKYKKHSTWGLFKHICEGDGTYNNVNYFVDGEMLDSVEMFTGVPIVPIDAPIKEGYTFSGWSEMPSVMPAHDLTVTGSFSVNQYKLTYIVDGVVASESLVDFGSEIIPMESPEKEGCSFSGWSEEPATMPAHDVVINGTFAANEYVLTYSVDGETYQQSQVVFGTAIDIIDAPIKKGYTFSGWSEIPSVMPAHDVTITGSFFVNQYKLTYIVDGEVVSESLIDFDSAIIPMESPEKEGCSFSGWSEEPITMPAHDVVINGTFAANEYVLTYSVDGETYQQSQVVFGAAIDIIDAPIKEGYTFSGWSEMPSVMPAYDVTITGNFVVNRYKVVYKVGDEIVKEFEVAYGEELPEYTYQPSEDRYTFLG